MANRQADDGKPSAQSVKMDTAIRDALSTKPKEHKEGASMNELIQAAIKDSGNTAEGKE